MSDDEEPKKVSFSSDTVAQDDADAEEALSSKQASAASASVKQEPEQAEASQSQHSENHGLSPSNYEVASSHHEVSESQHEVVEMNDEVLPSVQDITPSHEPSQTNQDVAPSEHEVSPSHHDVVPSEHEVTESYSEEVSQQPEEVLSQYEQADPQNEITESYHEVSETHHAISESHHESHYEVPDSNHETESHHEVPDSNHEAIESNHEVSDSHHEGTESQQTMAQSNASHENYDTASENHVPDENLENAPEANEDQSHWVLQPNSQRSNETYSVNDISNDSAILDTSQDLEVAPEDTGSKRPSSHRGSVKFSEPLNEPHELESQYRELMGEERSPDDFYAPDGFDDFPPELSQPSENTFTGQSSQMSHYSEEPQPTAEPTETLVPSTRTSRRMSAISHQTNELKEDDEINDTTYVGQQDPYGAFEITPEDIFNEIKIARMENPEHDKAQNLHSFIISKSYSSENVVVLLNLRRLKDGEWVLDKTIAQGLKPQTYGGVVSIDRYDFTERPSKQQIPEEHVSSKQASLQRVPEDAQAEVVNANVENRDIMEILKQMENYVREVNREIQAARELLKNAPLCKNGSPETSDESCEPPHFDELPFIDKLVKMFDVLIAAEDEPCCNLCNNVDASSDQNAISYWLRAVMQEISNYCPSMLLPTMLNDARNIATSSAAIISHSQAIMDEVKKSGLLDKLSTTGLLDKVSTTTGLLDTVSNASGIVSNASGLLDKASKATGLLEKVTNTGLMSIQSLASATKSFTKSNMNAESQAESVSSMALPTNSAVSNVGDMDSPESQAAVSASGTVPSTSVASHAAPTEAAQLSSKLEVDVMKPPPVNGVKDIDVSMDPSMAGSLQLNIESKSDLDEFIKEHEHE